jgi:hypothetical protein
MVFLCYPAMNLFCTELCIIKKVWNVDHSFASGSANSFCQTFPVLSPHNVSQKP